MAIPVVWRYRQASHLEQGVAVQHAGHVVVRRWSEAAVEGAAAAVLCLHKVHHLRHLHPVRQHHHANVHWNARKRHLDAPLATGCISKVRAQRRSAGA
jgi:hypothetical protein